MPKLKNNKHELFANEYIQDLNSGAAYVRVYGNVKGADQSASKLLNSTKVKARVAELSAEVTDDLQITATKILAEIGSIAFAKVTDIEVKDGKPVFSDIRTPDKLKALDLLVKIKGMATDKKDITVNDLKAMDFSGWTTAQIDEYIKRTEGDGA